MKYWIYQSIVILGFMVASILAGMFDKPFTFFESSILILALTGVHSIWQVSIDVSKIAKSLEKNAENKSSETSDEPGKK